MKFTNMVTQSYHFFYQLFLMFLINIKLLKTEFKLYNKKHLMKKNTQASFRAKKFGI